MLPTLLGPGGAEVKPTRFPGTNFTFSMYQHIGGRMTQEDRFALVPRLGEDSQGQCAFFGVFDGTVGDFASENVKDLIVPNMLESPNWQAARSCGFARSELLEGAVRDMYKATDEGLLVRCAKASQHYATCTSVTLLIANDLLVVGHLGDSRIILGKESEGGDLVGEQLTVDHKPDLPLERERIEACGGLVERLQNHGMKPFLRGGDFLLRKALGEQPMQLQYSHAFGAKDLKMFGLSGVPDVRVIRMGSPGYRRTRFVILASDGLWDVCSAQQAVTVAQHAVRSDQSPSEALVRFALLEQAKRKARADNVTAVCVMFD